MFKQIKYYHGIMYKNKVNVQKTMVNNGKRGNSIVLCTKIKLLPG